MKTTWIEDLMNNGPAQGTFLVSEFDVRQAKDGSSFLRLKLQDRTGSVDAIRWRVSDYERNCVQTCRFLEVVGRVETYQGRLQVIVDRMMAVNDGMDMADFLPCCPKDRDTMCAELAELIGTVSHPQVRRLLEMAVGETDLGQRFREAPGAVKVHHAYIGGLLEHTLSVVKLASMMAAHYPGLNRDLLIAGAILHDIGKTEEYEWDVRFGQSDSGILLGHIVQGALLVNGLMDEIPNFDPQWRDLLTHIVASHHGELQYGSPKVPMCKEALILHFIEDMDAKIQIIDKELAANREHAGDGNWTGRIQWLDRMIYRSVPEASASPARPSIEPV